MGCYGIGVTRIAAAAIEQNYDERGIIWPVSIAPFQLNIIAINYQNSDQVSRFCQDLYQKCVAAGIDVLLDERDLRLGSKLSDSDLIGIPYNIVVGERDLQAGVVELNQRQDGKREKVAAEELMAVLAGVGLG